MTKIKNKAKTEDVSGVGTISGPLREQFVRFIEYHPANRFSRNLRKMLLEFLMQDGAVESLYLKDLLYDLEGLFELFDAIEAEDGGEE